MKMRIKYTNDTEKVIEVQNLQEAQMFAWSDGDHVLEYQVFDEENNCVWAVKDLKFRDLD